MAALLPKPRSFAMLTADLLTKWHTHPRGSLQRHLFLPPSTLVTLVNSQKTELDPGEEMTTRAHSKSINK